ncbi:hypothetical protein [Xylophilus sp.]|uniref:hypothetical protein n=1 Tax=Xylophilus sp. TaxID=2653893 RepID=UPI002D7EA76A|nr:hypothetical protein [Xylophilus sp.]
MAHRAAPGLCRSATTSAATRVHRRPHARSADGADRSSAQGRIAARRGPDAGARGTAPSRKAAIPALPTKLPEAGTPAWKLESAFTESLGVDLAALAEPIRTLAWHTQACSREASRVRALEQRLKTLELLLQERARVAVRRRMRERVRAARQRRHGSFRAELVQTVLFEWDGFTQRSVRVLVIAARHTGARRRSIGSSAWRRTSPSSIRATRSSPAEDREGCTVLLGHAPHGARQALSATGRHRKLHRPKGFQLRSICI